MRPSRLVCLVLLSLLFSPTAAMAHAGLVSANPAANSSVTVMPEKIELTFSEDLMTIGEKNVNTISLNLLDGAEIPLTNIEIDGAKLTATIPSGNYESGSYEVFYSIVSADGHKVSDSYLFSLNAPTPLIAPAPSTSESHGALPLPIVGALAIVIALGGLYALRARSTRR